MTTTSGKDRDAYWPRKSRRRWYRW